MTQTNQSASPPCDTDSSTGKLTQRQFAILEYIQTRVAERGFPPSIREIGEAVNLSSPSTVKHHLDTLERNGFIVRTPGHARSLELVTQSETYSPNTDDTDSQDDPRLGCLDDDQSLHRHLSAPSNVHMIPIPVSVSEEDHVSIPLVGDIAAGAPMTAEQHVVDTFTIPTSLTGRGNLFMLRVSGDSMIDAGILDGDYVVVRSQPNAHDGQLVAAMIDDEATVKELSHDDSHVWLLPHNDMYEPILGDEAVILGIVVTVIRSL